MPFAELPHRWKDGVELMEMMPSLATKRFYASCAGNCVAGSASGARPRSRYFRWASIRRSVARTGEAQIPLKLPLTIEGA